MGEDIREQHIGRRQCKGEGDRQDASRGEDGDNRDDPRRPASGREERAGGREECGAPQRVARASLLPGPSPKGATGSERNCVRPVGTARLPSPPPHCSVAALSRQSGIAPSNPTPGVTPVSSQVNYSVLANLISRTVGQHGPKGNQKGRGLVGKALLYHDMNIRQNMSYEPALPRPAERWNQPRK